ncbi:MAG: hypothetical protein LBF67_05765 [Prevotellaceae bacterium]|nr:hypothetical protein [Prevotellaceae bacterium]
MARSTVRRTAVRLYSAFRSRRHSAPIPRRGLIEAVMKILPFRQFGAGCVLTAGR